MIALTKKIIFAIFLVFLFYFVLIFINETHAASFTHTFDTFYEVSDENYVKVRYEVKTINNNDTDHLDEIDLDLPFEIFDLNVDSSEYQVKFKSLIGNSKSNLYNLKLEFLNSPIGKGKSLNWALSFKVKNLILNYGTLKAIIIPKFAQENQYIKSKTTIKIHNKYGNLLSIYGGLLNQNESNNVFYVINSIENDTTKNIIILLGYNPIYGMEIDLSEISSNKFILPLDTNNQKIIYEDKSYRFFKDFSVSEYNNSLIFESLDNKEKIDNETLLKGYINLIGKYDELIIDNDSDLNYCLVNISFDESIINYLNNLNKNTDLSDYEKAKQAYLFLSRFVVNDFSNIYAGNIQNLTYSKELNAFELNLIYRYFLCYLNIKSKTVLGYVLPIQPVLFEYSNKAFPHIWTEFWDGKRWISADPNWYLSSKGTVYFDSNFYNHIKFVSFTDLFNDDIVNTFRNQSNFINVYLLDENINLNFNYLLDEALKFNIDNNVNYDGNFNINVQNISPKFVILNNLDLNCSYCSKIKTYSKLVIKPFESLLLNFDVKVNKTIFFNFESNLILNYEYFFSFFDSYKVKRELVLENINFESNLPSKTIEFISYIFIFINILFLISLIIYFVFTNLSHNKHL